MNQLAEIIDLNDSKVTAIVPSGNRVMTVDELEGRVRMMHDVAKRLMKEDVHFGKIPNVKKPCLYLPGAEILACAFSLAPKYTTIVTELPNGHRDYRVTCSLHYAGTDLVGEGIGSCSTMESKYRYRTTNLTCPLCHSETVFKDKNGDGHYCWAKKGGCGAKFQPGDPRISSQTPGRVEHENPADFYNTAQKMAAKRAFVSAIKTPTGASEIFTVDLEDGDETPEKQDPMENEKHRLEPVEQETTPEPTNLEITRRAVKEACKRNGRDVLEVVNYCISRFRMRPSELDNDEFGYFISWIESDRPISEWPDLEAEQIEDNTLARRT